MKRPSVTEAASGGVSLLLVRKHRAHPELSYHGLTEVSKAVSQAGFCPVGLRTRALRGSAADIRSGSGPRAVGRRPSVTTIDASKVRCIRKLRLQASFASNGSALH